MHFYYNAILLFFAHSGPAYKTALIHWIQSASRNCILFHQYIRMFSSKTKISYNRKVMPSTLLCTIKIRCACSRFANSNLHRHCRRFERGSRHCRVTILVFELFDSLAVGTPVCFPQCCGRIRCLLSFCGMSRCIIGHSDRFRIFESSRGH